jgi:DNA-binding NtrC family response regulator
MNELCSLKILLIEDDSNDAELFLSQLRAIDGKISIQWAERLSAGLDRLTSEIFDAVITDLDLPDSKGIETFLKINGRFPFIPVVVLSGLTDEAVAMAAVKKGAQDYLIKGRVQGDSILRSIRYAIERQRLLSVCDKQLKEIKTLKGLIPICAWCRRIHTDKGYWEKVETYIEKNTDASFSHGICPECLAKTEPGFFGQLRKNEPKLFEAAGSRCFL